MNEMKPQSSFNRIREHIGIRNGRLLKVYETESDLIYMYAANGGVFLVSLDAEGNTEIFVPASRSVSLDTTLQKLDEYIDGTI